MLVRGNGSVPQLERHAEVFDLPYRKKIKDEKENMRYLLVKARTAKTYMERDKYIARCVDIIINL